MVKNSNPEWMQFNGEKSLKRKSLLLQILILRMKISTFLLNLKTEDIDFYVQAYRERERRGAWYESVLFVPLKEVEMHQELLKEFCAIDFRLSTSETMKKRYKTYLFICTDVTNPKFVSVLSNTWHLLKLFNIRFVFDHLISFSSFVQNTHFCTLNNC